MPKASSGMFHIITVTMTAIANNIAFLILKLPSRVYLFLLPCCWFLIRFKNIFIDYTKVYKKAIIKIFFHLIFDIVIL